LPVAIRAGAGDPAALALMQAGLRPRVVAHLAARLMPPDADLDADALGPWARETIRSLADPDRLTDVGDAHDRVVLAAAAHFGTFS